MWCHGCFSMWLPVVWQRQSTQTAEGSIHYDSSGKGTPNHGTWDPGKTRQTGIHGNLEKPWTCTGQGHLKSQEASEDIWFTLNSGL